MKREPLRERFQTKNYSNKKSIENHFRKEFFQHSSHLRPRSLHVCVFVCVLCVCEHAKFLMTFLTIYQFKWFLFFIQTRVLMLEKFLPVQFHKNIFIFNRWHLQALKT